MAKKKVYPGFVQVPIEAPDTPEYIILELKHDSHLGYSAQGFAAPAD